MKSKPHQCAVMASIHAFFGGGHLSLTGITRTSDLFTKYFTLQFYTGEAETWRDEVLGGGGSEPTPHQLGGLGSDVRL